MAQTTQPFGNRMHTLGVATKRPPLRFAAPKRTRRTRSVTRAVPVDVSVVEHALRQLTGGGSQLPEIHGHVMNVLYSIADADSAAQVVQTVTDAATSDAVVETATQAATKSGPFTFIADGLESFLKVINSGLEAVHIPYSYGFSIIILTVLVKIITFPLSKQQVESSISMQALQPQLKEIQEKHKNNPQVVQQETAKLYQSAGVNPLAGAVVRLSGLCHYKVVLGCLPTLATIPVFIGLYRALLNAADEGVLKEGFFVIPSLAGPTTISARQAGTGLSWLFPFKDGAPPVGWHDAAAYLLLPTLLVVSQYVSQSVLQTTKSTDPSQGGMQTFLKVLPLLLGWFSLNVPSGLALYWITNNILTTGQQAYLKRGAPTPKQAPSTPYPPSSTTYAPPSANVIDTVATESKPTGVETGARRSKKQRATQEAADVGESRRKGDKFRARKAREAAKKAKSQRGRIGTGKKERKPFIQEQPNEDVVTAFEKELTASPLLPLSSEEQDKEKTESQDSSSHATLSSEQQDKEEVESQGSNNRM